MPSAERSFAALDVGKGWVPHQRPVSEQPYRTVGWSCGERFIERGLELPIRADRQARDGAYAFEERSILQGTARYQLTRQAGLLRRTGIGIGGSHASCPSNQSDVEECPLGRGCGRHSERNRMSYCRQTGSPFCFRRLLSNADSGTKRRRKLTWRAIFPAA